jgi:hypothetical protein
MNLTETAKQLAKHTASRPSGATPQEPTHLDLMIEKIHREEFQKQLVDSITEQIAPLSIALDTIGKESQTNLAQMKQLTSTYLKDLVGSFQKAEAAAQAITERSQSLTRKLWAWMLLASILASPMSVLSYCVWQRQHEGEKQAAANWHDLLIRWHQLSPDKARQAQRLLYETQNQ